LLKSSSDQESLALYSDGKKKKRSARDLLLVRGSSFSLLVVPQIFILLSQESEGRERR